MYHNSIIFQNKNTLFINTDFLAKFPDRIDSLERMVYPEVDFFLQRIEIIFEMADDSDYSCWRSYFQFQILIFESQCKFEDLKR